MDGTNVSSRTILVATFCLAAISGAVQATCWKIHTSSTQHNSDGTCVTGCDHAFPQIYPGGNCAAPYSTGSMQVVCFTGTTFVNPDGSVGCSTDGFPTLMTVSSGIGCQLFCRVPLPR